MDKIAFYDWVRETQFILEAMKTLNKNLDGQYQIFADFLRDFFNDMGEIDKITFGEGCQEIKLCFDKSLKLDLGKLAELPFNIDIETEWETIILVIHPMEGLKEE